MIAAALAAAFFASSSCACISAYALYAL